MSIKKIIKQAISDVLQFIMYTVRSLVCGKIISGGDHTTMQNQRYYLMDHVLSYRDKGRYLQTLPPPANKREK